MSRRENGAVSLTSFERCLLKRSLSGFSHGSGCALMRFPSKNVYVGTVDLPSTRRRMADLPSSSNGVCSLDQKTVTGNRDRNGILNMANDVGHNQITKTNPVVVTNSICNESTDNNTINAVITNSETNIVDSATDSNKSDSPLSASFVTATTHQPEILGIDHPIPATTIVRMPFTLNLKSRISRSTLVPSQGHPLNKTTIDQPCFRNAGSNNVKMFDSDASSVLPEILGVDLQTPATAVVMAPFTLNLKSRISRHPLVVHDQTNLPGNDGVHSDYSLDSVGDSIESYIDVTNSPEVVDLSTSVVAEPITLNPKAKIPKYLDEPRPPGTTSDDDDMDETVVIEPPTFNLKSKTRKYLDEPRPPGTTSDDEDADDYAALFGQPKRCLANIATSAELWDESLTVESKQMPSVDVEIEPFKELTLLPDAPPSTQSINTILSVKREIYSDDDNELSQKRICQRDGFRVSTSVTFRSKVDVPSGGYCELCQVRYPGSLFDHRVSNQHKTNRALSRPSCTECSRTFDSASAYWHHCVLIHERAATIQVEVDEFEHLWQVDRLAEKEVEVEEKGKVVDADIDVRFFVDDAIASEDDDDSVQEVFSDEENEPFVYSSGNVSSAQADCDLISVPAFYCNVCKTFFEAGGDSVDSHRLTDEHVKYAKLHPNGFPLSWNNDTSAADEDVLQFDERYFVDYARDTALMLDSDDNSDDAVNEQLDRQDIVPACYCKRCFDFFHEAVVHTCQVSLI